MQFTSCLQCRDTLRNNCFNRHIAKCDGSGKRKSKGFGKLKWNSGLTAATDERVAANAKNISKALVGKPGHSPSFEHRKRLSEFAISRGFGGTTQSKWIEYRGIKLGSTYELLLAQDLDANQINWEKPKRLKYIDPFGKQRTYTADFYLPDYDVYLDPKNDFLLSYDNPSLGFSDTLKIKLVCEQNCVKIHILNKSQLTWLAVQNALET